MIALGVIAGVWLFGRRLEAKGIGTRDDANAIAIWGVLAGVIGARLYHVITDWERFEDDLGDIVKIWEGGLGIPGGMLAGVLVGAYVGHCAAASRSAPALNAVAPALPLAQAIGRWGNYFNQELFGGPTDLPWALEVDPETAIEAGYAPGTTFHPTFLYESLWQPRPVRPAAVDRQALQPGRRSAAGDVRARLRRRSASGSRGCASTPPTSSAGCAGTSGSPWPASSAAACT